MTPPSKTRNTPAMLLRPRLCVSPVLDCDGFGHWLRSSHHFRRVFSMKYVSRNCKDVIKQDEGEINSALGRNLPRQPVLSRLPYLIKILRVSP